MTQRVQTVDRETAYLFPPSVQDWLPETHVARFVVEVVEGLALRDLVDSYAGRGTAAYPPQMLVSLLFYGYATGVFSSRKHHERASSAVSILPATARQFTSAIRAGVCVVKSDRLLAPSR
jgi:transposase